MAGLLFFDGCLIEEKLAWGSRSIRTSLGAYGMAAAPGALGGSDEVQCEYFTDLVENNALARPAQRQ